MKVLRLAALLMALFYLRSLEVAALPGGDECQGGCYNYCRVMCEVQGGYVVESCCCQGFSNPDGFPISSPTCACICSFDPGSASCDDWDQNYETWYFDCWDA